VCLRRIYDKNYQKRLIKKYTKNGYIKVYRFVTCYMGEFKSPICNYRFRNGLNRANNVVVNCSDDSWELYWTGFHSYFTKKDAMRWTWRQKSSIIVECLIKPEWIIVIGQQDGTCVVSSKIYMPDFPNREVSVKNFKQDCENEESRYVSEGDIK